MAPPPVVVPPPSRVAPHIHADTSPYSHPGGGAWSHSHARRYQPTHATKLAQAEGWEEALAELEALGEGADPETKRRDMARVGARMRPEPVLRVDPVAEPLEVKVPSSALWSVRKGVVRRERELAEHAELKADQRAGKMGVGRVVNLAAE